MLLSTVLKAKGNDVIAVNEDTKVVDIARIIATRRIGAVLVTDADGKLAGIVSERDVVKGLAWGGDEIHEMLARAIMSRNVVTATPETTVAEAMEIMDRGYFRHLPVLDGDKLVGIVSVRDTVRAHIESQGHEVETLKSYIFRA
jgi:CBS domain-containing protein